MEQEAAKFREHYIEQGENRKAAASSGSKAKIVKTFTKESSKRYICSPLILIYKCMWNVLVIAFWVRIFIHYKNEVTKY